MRSSLAYDNSMQSNLRKLIKSKLREVSSHFDYLRSHIEAQKATVLAT